MKSGTRYALAALVLLMLLHPFAHTHAEPQVTGVPMVDDLSVVRDCPCLHAVAAAEPAPLVRVGLVPVTELVQTAPDAEPLEVLQGKIPARAPPAA